MSNITEVKRFVDTGRKGRSVQSFGLIAPAMLIARPSNAELCIPEADSPSQEAGTYFHVRRLACLKYHYEDTMKAGVAPPEAALLEFLNLPCFQGEGNK